MEKQKGLVVSRQIGESVRVGQDLFLTLIGWDRETYRVDLEVGTPAGARKMALNENEPETLEENPVVEVEFRGFHGGNARVAFIAPKEVRIERLDQGAYVEEMS